VTADVPRLPLTPESATDPRVAAVFEAVLGRGRSLPNLYRTLAHAPAMLEAWTNFAWPLRTECRAPRALRELVILRAAHLSGSDYEWAHHVPMARESGVTEQQLECLPAWRQASCFDPLQRATLDVVDCIVGDGHVPDEPFDRLRQLVDEQQLVEIVLTASFYVCVARVLAALNVELEPEYAALRPRRHAPDEGERP
jgi:AhpD family alkylhydroperoxidase